MELIYKIEFFSTNFYYKHIIDEIITKSGTKAHTKFYEDLILIVCDDVEEKIESLFKLLEQKLPLSIFLGKAEVIEKFDFDAFKEIEDKDVKVNLALLTNDEITKTIEENNVDFFNDIELIKKGKISRIDTHNGVKDFFLPSTKLREEFEEKGYEVKLLITDINNITDLVEISQKDLQLLCSIERPLVKLKFKLLQNSDTEFSKTRFIYAKVPDDRETLLFANALKKEGFSYILYTADDIYQDGLKVTYSEGQTIIIHGEKGLFPKYEYKLDRKVINIKDYFDEYGSVYKACIDQFYKKLVPTIGIYFSYKSDESAIKINLPGVGIKDVIHIPNVFNSIENCFEDIKSLDENTLRLVDNYKNKYATYFEKEFKDTDSDGFESILNLLAYILGMRDYKEFEDIALAYNSKSGIQIDMNIVKIDGKNYLDYRRVIQSTMSYKMAGVQDSMLAYSFYESLSDFIKDNVEKINSELKAKDLILCGDMFGNTILLSKVKKAINNINILIPKEYPLDF
ncbi:MAG: hypothetical protein ACNI25_08540 [Halarcobacter sp.]